MHNTFILLLICVITVFAKSNFLPTVDATPMYEPWILEKWIEYNTKGYMDIVCGPTSLHAECRYRLQIFAQKLRYFEEFNKQNNSYTIGITSFTHLTYEEFKEIQKRSEHEENQLRQLTITAPVWSFENVTLPDEWDWTQEGAVTYIKNQGNCGGCYSFATTGALEGLNFINNSILLAFSEQQILDCSKGPYGNTGCQGGNYFNSFAYVHDYPIATETEYPFLGKDGTFCFDYKYSDDGYTIESFYKVNPNDPVQFQLAVFTQPIAIEVNDSDSNFMDYTGGVYDGKCQSKYPTHSVLCVGWGIADGVEYWIIKNSWGTAWGINGYMWLIKDMTPGPGKCAIYTTPAFPSNYISPSAASEQVTVQSLYPTITF